MKKSINMLCDTPIGLDIHKTLSVYTEGLSSSDLFAIMESFGYDRDDIAREVRNGLDREELELGWRLRIVLKKVEINE